MTTFRIDAENNITAFASEQIEESGGETEIFTNQQELAQAAGKWPAARLVAIWNSLPGVEPVQRFTSRQVAVTRIWKARALHLLMLQSSLWRSKNRLLARRRRQRENEPVATARLHG